MTTRRPGAGPVPVPVGSYALELGPSVHSFAQFQPEREGENAPALAAALAGGPAEFGVLEAVEELQASAATVTDSVQRANELLRSALEGKLLDPEALKGEVAAMLDLLGRLDRSGRYKEELRLTRALFGLLLLLLRWVELVHSLRATLNAARKAGDEPGVAWALHELGTLHLIAGDAKTAGEHLDEALRLEQRLGDGAGRCVTRHNLDCAQRDLAAKATLERRPRRLLRLAGLFTALSIVAGAGTTLALAVSGGGADPKDAGLRPALTTTGSTSRATSTRRLPPTATKPTTDPTTTPTTTTPATGTTPATTGTTGTTDATTASGTTRMTSTATTPTTTTTTTTTTAPPPDLVEPEVSLTAPANGSALAIATPDFAGIAGAETGDDDVVELFVERDAAPVDGYPVSVAVDNGAWAFTPPIALADGLYTAVVSQHDAAGNTGANSPTSFTVDTTPPTLSLKCPSSLAATITCTLTLDESGTAHVEVYEILSDGKTERQLDTLGSIDLQADTPQSLKLELGSVSGIAVRIMAGAHDTAGNEAEAQRPRASRPLRRTWASPRRSSTCAPVAHSRDPSTV